jgi:molybdopterin molybdotransferase
VRACGGDPLLLGIAGDDASSLRDLVRSGLSAADLLLVSGGSSVGARDLTLDVVEDLPDSEVLLHGVAIRPGKPTILARVGAHRVWGLPGHVASCMVVFEVLVRPMIERLSGEIAPRPRPRLRARLTRNVASVHGRTDFLRVRLAPGAHGTDAVPLLGRSGLLRPMVQADGLVEIPRDREGLDAGTEVEVILL